MSWITCTLGFAPVSKEDNQTAYSMGEKSTEEEQVKQLKRLLKKVNSLRLK